MIDLFLTIVITMFAIAIGALLCVPIILIGGYVVDVFSDYLETKYIERSIKKYEKEKEKRT